MRAFHSAFPDVDLRFQLISGSLKGPIGNVDLGMRRTEPGVKDAWTTEFAPEIILPVCSPSYLSANGPIESNSTSASHVLIQLSDSEIDWRSMLPRSAHTRIPHGNWIEFSDYAVVIQTAMSGQGIALGWVSAISRGLLDGTLVPASRLRKVTGNTFSLVAPRGRALPKIVPEIRNWMIAEMRQDLDRLEPMLGAASLGGRRD
ncbi:MAG TPA: LysR substrate-binding domain-containing protein [Hyphomicrobiaceae bacterium]|nr:LysR substrate-binding domain-containing protein [Hyphomicrobiaceae bacterium]